MTRVTFTVPLLTRPRPPVCLTLVTVLVVLQVVVVVEVHVDAVLDGARLDGGGDAVRLQRGRHDDTVFVCVRLCRSNLLPAKQQHNNNMNLMKLTFGANW